jgi:hypothetical protein
VQTFKVYRLATLVSIETVAAWNINANKNQVGNQYERTVYLEWEQVMTHWTNQNKTLSHTW